MRSGPFFAGFLLATTALLPLARAQGTPLRASHVEAKSVRVDGIPKEWTGFVPLSHVLRGPSGKPDAEARVVLGYDANDLYVAAEITDDLLRAGADHLQLVLGFPGGTTQEVLLYPGAPGKAAAAAKTKDGAAIRGAKVVEAPQDGGWTLEASIPWSTFPQAKAVRVGLRGAVFFHDADSGAAIETVLGTAPSAAYATLPPLSNEAEQALAEGLMKDKQLYAAPRCNLMADVVGDAMKERVLVFDHYLVVLGPTYRNGSEYYFGDLAGAVVSCETRDVTGDGQADILIKRRSGTATKYRDSFLVQSFGGKDVPTTVFEHETGIGNELGSVTNEVAFAADGGKVAIRIAPGTAKGLSAANYREPTQTSYDPLLLPWGTIASQTYKVSGGRFAKASEDAKAGVAGPAAAPRAAAPVEDSSLPKAPPPPSAGELQEQVYELYKKDRGVSGRPRFDLAIDVSGDRQSERVLLHDRDIVVFGKGFKGGSGYAFLTLAQFQAPSDILELTAKDLTGDGKAEIVVRGMLHANAPPQAGGGTIDREVVIVLMVAQDSVKRIFAAETARSIGKKRVAGAITLSANGIQLSPGRATEWTEKTYPFNQDTTPVGGFEPLLLPWSGAGAVRYRWTGTGFSR